MRRTKFFSTLTAMVLLGALGACQKGSGLEGAPETSFSPIPILSGKAAYENLPIKEQAWWGSVFQDTSTGAAYGLEFYDTPLDVPIDDVGQLDLIAGEQESKLAPFAHAEDAVIIYGKAELDTTTYPSSFGKLHVGEIAPIVSTLIGCDPRRLTEAQRQGVVVVAADCNHYLELPEVERLYTGVLKVGERGGPPPPDRSQYFYYFDTPERRLFIGVPPRAELEALLEQAVSVQGKVVEVTDGRGPHQVLRVGLVRP